MKPDWHPYISWAKLHPRAQFELTNSGATVVELSGLIEGPWQPDLAVTGPYGELAWIEAIARWRSVDPDWVIPAPGTSMANFLALATAAKSGDTVVIEAPAYDPLLRAAEFLGLHCRPARRMADQRYRFDLDGVRAELAAGARAVMITDLHNPSGLATCPTDQESLIALTAEFGATLIVDEVYLDYSVLNAGYQRHSAAMRGDHVMVTDSLTKVYGLGPLRAGWLIAHPDRLARVREVIDLLYVVNPPVSSRLAVQALANVDELSRRSRSIYQSGYSIYAAWLEAQVNHLVGAGNDGALFGWIRLPEGVQADSLADRLYKEYDTNIVPGTFFGCPDHVRVSFGVAPHILTEGLRRIEAALDDIRQS